MEKQEDHALTPKATLCPLLNRCLGVISKEHTHI